MNWRRAFSVAGPAAVGFGMAATYWSRVPDEMPIHWDAAGDPNGWAPKAVGLLIMPVTALLVSGTTNWAMHRGEARGKADLVTGMIGGFHVLMSYLMIQAALGDGTTSVGLVMVLVSALMMGLAWVMPSLSQNRWAGVRTPWTLADEVNWKLTHRFAMWTMGIGGALGVVAGLVVPGSHVVWAALVPVLIGALAPLPYSYVIHRLRAS